MRRTVLLIAALLALASAPLVALEVRFPKPEFESGYVPPETTAPPARADMLDYMDVAVLVLALSLASYIALRTRSRREMLLLTIFSVLYFGFWRKGCVCAVGSVQNIALAIFDAGYAVPLTVIAFFALPLIFALFFGRTFCAAVCPLGTIQDLVLTKPVKVPFRLQQTLGLLPHLYLGVAVLFAALGARFVICRYDPFVGFFRLGGDTYVLIFGAALLLTGVFVGRPYCRFLCPYGVLLGWASRLSWRHASITPDKCIQCRLCEGSCPFDAIRAPTPAGPPETRRKGISRLALMLLLTPILIAGAGWIVSRLNVPLARIHPAMALAEQIRFEDTRDSPPLTKQSEAFRGSGRVPSEVYADAADILGRFRVGGWFLGGFIGLILAGRLIDLSIRRTRTDYEPDRTTCLSCARCFTYCPRERDRLKKKGSGVPPDGPQQRQ